jgi:GNAT superfamily N-acetyltransferase
VSPPQGLFCMRLLVTYLEMMQPPAGSPLVPPTAHAAVARERLSIEDYTMLYRAVGQPVQWDQRIRLGPEKLALLMASELFDLYILRVEGGAGGFCEFVRHDDLDTELVHFGLVPEIQGRGFGRYLLDLALRFVWNYQPRRVWLHTDTLDHSRALPLYQSFGFREYARQLEDFPD